MQNNSLLCPSCRKLISRDEPHCPYCGLKSPGSRWKSSVGVLSSHDPDLLIKQIIIVNSVMFILSLLLKPGGMGMALSPFDFLSPDNRSLFLLGATGTLPIDAMQRWWSLIAANFLHGNLMHILFNMVALKQIGPLVIKEYGAPRMLIIYILGGVFGYIISYLAGIRFTIGASASICALIGAAIYYGKSRGGTYGQAIYSQIGGWAVFLFIFGFIVPGINNWGHGGGMLGGALLALFLGYREKKRETLAHKALAAASVAISLMTLVFAVGSAVLYLYF